MRKLPVHIAELGIEQVCIIYGVRLTRLTSVNLIKAYSGTIADQVVTQIHGARGETIVDVNIATRHGARCICGNSIINRKCWTPRKKHDRRDFDR